MTVVDVRPRSSGRSDVVASGRRVPLLPARRDDGQRLARCRRVAARRGWSVGEARVTAPGCFNVCSGLGSVASGLALPEVEELLGLAVADY